MVCEGINDTSMVDTSIAISLQRFFIVWYGFNSICGTFGNVLVIICIVTSRKLQTYTNSFVMNLSIADVLVCSVCMPVEIYFFAHRQDGACQAAQQYPNLCFVIGMMMVGLCSVSIFSLAWISFNRYLLIVHGTVLYRKLFNKRFVPLMIGCCWIWGCSVLLPPFIGWGGFGYNEAKGMCDFDHSKPSNYERFVIYVSINLPLIITLFSYVQIFVKVRKSALRIAQHELAVNRKEERRKRDLKLTKDLSIIFGVFCLCVTPYTLAEIIDHEYEILKIELHLFASILFASNSTWNPFLYAWRNKDFRNAMKRVMCFKGYGPLVNEASVVATVTQQDQAK